MHFPRPNLSGDLLIDIFESIVPIEHPTAAYKDLVNLALVCRSWALPGTQVLLSHVEILWQREGDSLIRCIQSGAKGSLVRTLVLGVRLENGYGEEEFINRNTFHRILSLTSHLRRLIILPFSDPDSHFYPQRPHLPFLEEVTIAEAATFYHTYQNPDRYRLQATVIGILPSHVRFLNLLDVPDAVPPGTLVHSLQLYGLTVPSYPTPLTDAVLAQSRTTLQSLTTEHISSLAFLALYHPNLRSLRILATVEEALGSVDFRVFDHLERLEVRDTDLRYGVAYDLPKTLRYLRFWSIRMASSLADLLQNDYETRLPLLRTIIWEYSITKNTMPVPYGHAPMTLATIAAAGSLPPSSDYAGSFYSMSVESLPWSIQQLPPPEDSEERVMDLRERLELLCLEKGIELRTALRADGGVSPGLVSPAKYAPEIVVSDVLFQGPDLVYESTFRRSCFTNNLGLSSHTTGYVPPSSLRLPSPLRTLAQLDRLDSISPFPWWQGSNVPQYTFELPRPSLWDDHFEGHSKWLNDTLPHRQQRARDRSYPYGKPPKKPKGSAWTRGTKFAAKKIRSWLAPSSKKKSS